MSRLESTRRPNWQEHGGAQGFRHRAESRVRPCAHGRYSLDALKRAPERQSRDQYSHGKRSTARTPSPLPALDDKSLSTPKSLIVSVPAVAGISQPPGGGEDANLKHARAAQTAFDNYAPILIFGILGYSMKEVVLKHDLPGYSNVAAFALLLAAGLISLWRLERLPKFYVNAAEVNSATETRNYLVRLLQTRSADEELKTWLSNTGAQLAHFGSIEAAEKAWALRTYAVQKWCFIAGISLLLIARVLPVFIGCSVR